MGSNYYVYPSQAFDYTVLHDTGAVVSIGSWGRSFSMVGATENALYQLNGGTIISEAQDAFSGYGYWQIGGTMEVTADSQITVTHATVLAEGFSGTVDEWIGYPGPVLKFTGTDIKLTMDANVYLMAINPWGLGDPDPNSVPVQLDVSGLTLSDPDNWFTIIQTTSLTYGELLGFVTGTDASWELQVAGNPGAGQGRSCLQDYGRREPERTRR